jgi:putative ABC transport system permease protein
MEYKEIIVLAIQALKNNILRTALTMLGIIIGITAVILIVSIGRGAVAFITEELTSFGTDYFQINPGSTQFSTFAGANTITFDDVEAIKNDTSLTNIKSVVPIAMASVTITANGEEASPLLYGSTSEILGILRPDVVDGEFMTEEEVQASEKVAVLGSELAEKLFGEDTSPVGEIVRVNNRTFRVVGVINSSSALAGGFINNAMIAPIDVVVDQIIGEEKLQEIDISVHDPNTINQTIEDVEQLLRDRHDLDEDDENDFQIQSSQDMLTTVQTITGLLTTMIAAISAISLIVGGVGVMNIMLVSVTERTKEIGLLKAIGAKEKDILTQFLIEAVVMTSLGGIVGIILGISGAFLISLVVGIPFVIDIVAILMAVTVSTLVGIVFGLYPARRAARLSPIDALRYE